MSKVSFVIPTYNAGEWIAESVQSCLDQTERDIEVVVVNDSSSDCTDEILQYFVLKDKRVKVITLNYNMGRSEARNQGNGFAISPIICVLDADDVNYPQRAMRTIEFFDAHPHIDIVYSEAELISATGETQGKFIVKDFDIKEVLEKKATFICHSSMSYRGIVADTIKYSDGEYSSLGIDDWKFQMDAYRARFKFAPIREMLVKYRTLGTTELSRNKDAVARVKDSYINNL